MSHSSSLPLSLTAAIISDLSGRQDMSLKMFQLRVMLVKVDLGES
jgi:hypothetical protein